MKNKMITIFEKKIEEDRKKIKRMEKSNDDDDSDYLEKHFLSIQTKE